MSSISDSDDADKPEINKGYGDNIDIEPKVTDTNSTSQAPENPECGSKSKVFSKIEHNQPSGSDLNANPCQALVPLSQVSGGPNSDSESVLGILDMIGNKMAFSILREKRDLDFVLSWLSTLGGACSALGDKSKPWALEAGKISLKQLKIGMKLGDPLITARCYIYIGISLIQRGKLKEGRRIIENVFNYVKYQLPEGSDPKLIRMCLGVWAKLKYEYELKKESRNSIIGNSSKNLKAICM